MTRAMLAGLFLIVLTAGRSAGAGVQVLRQGRVPQIPNGFGEPVLHSANGRWLLFHSYGPGSAQNNLHVVDLSGKRRPASLAYVDDPTFVQDGNSLACWRYDLGGGSGLYVRNLETGQERRIYPATSRLENSGKALRGNSGVWKPATGELSFRVSNDKHPDVQYALRLQDGRLRRLGEAGEPRRTVPGGRTAFTRTQAVSRFSTQTYSVWVSQPGGKDRRLAGGQLVDWLDNGHLLVARSGGLEDNGTRVLFRVDAGTAAERLLLEHPETEVERLDPSRRWLGVRQQDRILMVSTEDGRSAVLPAPGVTAFFWGTAPGTLYYQAPDGWRRAEVRIDAGNASAPARSRPDTVRLPLSAPAVGTWRPLEPQQGPWQTYYAAPRTVTARRIGGQTWVGTTQGLRVLDPQGREVPLLSWQAALRGRRIDWITPDGNHVFLGARRASPYNAGDWEAMLVRADLKMGRAEQQAMDASGFGSNRFLQQFLPGPPALALVGPYPRVELRDGGAVRRAMDPVHPERDFPAFCVAPHGDGAVWIGNQSGLFRWHPERGTAEHWSAKHGLPTSLVLSAAVLDGRVWIGTGEGLVVLDPDTGAFTPPGAGGPAGEPVLQLLTTPDTLYAVSETRLAAFHRGRKRWTRLPLPPGSPVTLQWDGSRLLGTSGPDGPLLTFNGRDWKEVAPFPAGGPPDNAITALHWQDGQLWCGFEGAVARLDPGTGEWKTYPLPADVRSVQHLASEGESLFAGLFKGGVVELNVRTGALRRWLRPKAPDPDDDNRGSQLAVEGLVAEARYLYVFSHLGFFRLDRRTGAEQDFASASSVRGGQILQSDGKSVWVLTRGDVTPEDRVVRFSLPDFRPQPVSNPLGLRQFGPYASEPERGFWFLKDGPTLGSVEGRVLAHFPLPRRFRGRGFERLAWSPGSLWLSVAGRTPEDAYLTVITRVALEGGEWQELPPCPLSGVTQMVAAGGSLWVATHNGLARLPQPEQQARAVAGLDRAPLPPDKEIFLALRYKDFAEVKQLLDGGLPVDTRPYAGQTPLMTAVSMGWSEMVTFLLDRGAKVNAVDEQGRSPLVLARNVEIARLLLDRGADPNVKVGKEDYPLLIERLVRDQELKIARLLIDRGADVNVQDPTFGLTPLLAATQFNHPEFVRPLLDKGAKVNILDKDGRTPLMSAVTTSGEDLTVFRLLLDRGADVNLAGKEGDTALHWAAGSYNLEVLRELLRRGAKLEAVGSHGWTPLLVAVAQLNFQAVPVLVQAGADVNARSKSGQTALMFAARRGEVETVKLLLARGAQVNVKDGEGKTASKMARESGNVAVAKLLAAAGEKP